MGAVTSAVEEVIYSIQIKTSDKLFAGTDNDVYLRIGCVISQTQANIDEVNRGASWVPMVIWPEFRMGLYRANDHPSHAPQFIYILRNQKKTDW